MLKNSVLGKATLKAKLSTMSVAALLLVAMGSGDAARAALVAAICDDAACLGGNDIIVTDNASTGVVVASANFPNAFGFSLLFNLAQSKPLIGSPAVPHLDLNFTVTGGSGTVYLYASDTDFTTSPTGFNLSVGGTSSKGSVSAGAWGGNSNTLAGL
jgi:hypothetical protein